MSFAERVHGARDAAARAIAIGACSALVSVASHAVSASAFDVSQGKSAGTTAMAPAAPREETRALWVLRTSLTTPDSIATLVRSAREHGFNTLLVQVRGRGDAYYLGGVEPRPAELLRQPDTFDPLATVIEAGHAAGLRVHAWINVNLISSATDLPAAREHIVYRHPGWLMIPRDIAQELAAIEPESPAYVGKLARWTRTQPTEIEGLYTSPIIPEAAEYTESLVRDLSHRYALDGVHLDYARYPSDRFDYSRPAIREFRASVRGRLADAARRTLDAQEGDDLFAYPDALPDEWRSFRIARMTALVDRLTRGRQARAAGRACLRRRGSRHAGCVPPAAAGLGRMARRGLVDAICPMAYTTEPARFAEQIAAAREAAGTRAVWAGIGAYRLSPKETIDNILTARRLGASGVILFSYDSMVDPRQTSPDYLAVVGRAAFTIIPPGSAGSR